jgi:tetratricopeptide (TPR) repeat protein
MRVPHGLLLAAAAVLIATAATPGIARPETRPSPETIPAVAAVLDRYAAGRFDEAVAGAAALEDLRPFRARFFTEAPGWIGKDPATAPRREAVAAAFGLELTYARLESEWGMLRELVEWSCGRLRAAGTPTPFERAWHLAALSLAGRARDRVWLLGQSQWLPDEPPRRQIDPALSPLHMTHAAERMPGDPRVRLEWLTAFLWSRDRGGFSFRGLPAGVVSTMTKRHQAALDALRALGDEPATAADARLQLARMRLVEEDAGGALEAARHALSASPNAPRRYVAHVIAGRALEALGRPQAAADEYARALEAVPGAESASIALASLRFLDGERADARQLIERSFARTPQMDDPWRLVSYGSFAHWPQLAAAMRAEVSK